jgi:uncharacterized protein (TIGR02118 family)
MVTITFLLRRRDDVDEAEFHRYWREEHGPLVASRAEVLGIRRYEQLHSLDPAMSEALRASRDCEAVHYDGVALVSFDSLEALGAAVQTPEGQAAGAELLEDERRFLDLERCVIWLADTHVVV